MSNLDPTKITVISGATGILSCVFFFTMNTTINYLTIPTLLLGDPPNAKIPLASKSIIPATSTTATSISHLNRQWQEIYYRGHRVGPSLALLGTAAYGTASIFAEQILVKRLTGVAAVTMFAAVPYTLLVMVPTNDELHRRGNAVTEPSTTGKDVDEKGTSKLLAKWVGMSKVRANIALVGACLGAAGLAALI